MVDVPGAAARVPAGLAAIPPGCNGAPTTRATWPERRMWMVWPSSSATKTVVGPTAMAS